MPLRPSVHCRDPVLGSYSAPAQGIYAQISMSASGRQRSHGSTAFTAGSNTQALLIMPSKILNSV